MFPAANDCLREEWLRQALRRQASSMVLFPAMEER